MSMIRLKMIKLTLVAAVFFTLPAFAAGDHHGTPWDMVIKQLINFSLLAGLLIYFLKDTVASHFSTRYENYFAEVKKAEAIKQEAEAKKKEITLKLQELSRTSATAEADAQKEAALLMERLNQEAERQIKKIESEAQKTCMNEVDKANEKLRIELLEKSVELAHSELVNSVGDLPSKHFKDEFFEKIKVVQ